MAKEETMYAEVSRIYKRKIKSGEPPADFLLAILKKMNADEDDSYWDQLRDTTQQWLNARMDEDNKEAGKFSALLEPDEEVKQLPAPASRRRTAKAVEADNSEAGADAEAEAGDGADDKESTSMAKTAAKKKPASSGKSAAAKGSEKGSARRKVAAASNGTGTRGRKGTYALDATIKIVSKENPKRPGSEAYDRFAKYKNGMSVQDALNAGVRWDDMRWDVSKNFVAIK